MFTGIIQDIGVINFIEKGLYRVSTSLNLNDCKEGSSISCNGVCLTAKNIYQNDENKFFFEVNISEETLFRTNLGNIINKNNKINIEKSLKVGDEIGGHFVYGHVDTITSITNIKKINNSWEFYFKKDFGKNNKFISEKVSVAINGISLTIAKIENSVFMTSIIDHTFNHTNLKFMNISDVVNIEFDYLARFIENE